MAKGEHGSHGRARRRRRGLGALYVLTLCLIVAATLGMSRRGDSQVDDGRAAPAHLSLATDPRLLPQPGPPERHPARSHTGANGAPAAQGPAARPPCVHGRVVDGAGRALVHSWVMLEESAEGGEALEAAHPQGLDAEGRFTVCLAPDRHGWVSAGAPRRQPASVALDASWPAHDLTLVLLREPSPAD